ncbi:MAG: glycosyltransferase [Bacteroidales bacterium]|nr:MAG: glycosyltransferase [Bacteroidales bacterium]
MKSKTICFFNSTKAWGGGEKWHYDISVSLNRKGYSTLVITNKKSVLYSRIILTGQKVFNIRISNLSFLNPVKLLLLRKVFIKENIDIIIINLSADLKVAGIAARLAGISRIIYRRGSAIPIKNRWLNRIIFKNIVTDIIANSEETKRTVLQNNPELFPPGKIKVIYNGIDTGKYDISNEKRLYKKYDNEIILGNMGRLVRQKGQKYLIDIAAVLKANDLQFKILIGGEGPLRQELVSYAEKCKVADKIIFLGFVDNVVEFMNSIDIFLLTSLWEGFGYVIVEAMVCKKPVMAFNCSSNPELIEENKTGFLVEPGNIRSFVEKLEILINDKELRTGFGQQGYIKARKEFSVENTTGELENFLEIQ